MQKSSIQIFKAIGALIDGCYTGAWWWRLRFWLAEQELVRALGAFGEDSMQVRVAHAHWARMDFAVQFGRPAPGPVRELVRHALRHGVPAEDLWFMVLNREIGLTDKGRISVKRGSWLLYLLGMPVGLICLSAIWVCLSSIDNWPLSGGQKLVCLMLTIIWYWPAWRGWTLHYWRAPRALLRSGAKVESFSKMPGRALVLAIPSRAA